MSFCCLLVILLCGCSTQEEPTTLKALVKDHATIYLLENGSYVPFCVVDGNYSDGVLVMREQLTAEQIPFRDTNVFNTGGSYYPGSQVDLFLNETYLMTLDETVRSRIMDSTITVSSLETILYGKRPAKTEQIQRKVFLLSATEVGIRSGMTGTEGRALAYFDDCVHPGPQWLRSAYLWDDLHAWMLEPEGPYEESVSTAAYVRPVFVLPGDTAITESEEVIAGRTVFVLD